MSTGFWAVIDAQLTQLRTAKSADEVIAILATDREEGVSSGDGFFAGSGGDETVLGALRDAGWKVRWIEADYYWCAVAPDGSLVSYVEGDVYRGDSQHA